MMVPNFLKKKWLWIIIVLVVLVGGGSYYRSSKNGQTEYVTEKVSRQAVVQSVSATGTLNAAENIDLGFKTAGRLQWMKVKVGDQVKAGQILAGLDDRDVRASVLSAQANLNQAQANLDKIKAGNQVEDIAVTEASVQAAKIALENAENSLERVRATQNQAVSNALAQLVGIPVQAIPSKSNISTISVTVTGTYNGTEQGVYTIRLDNYANLAYSVFGLENTFGPEGSRAAPTPLGTRGLKIQFSSTGTYVAGDTWTVEIPNTNYSSYASLQAAYEAALTNQKQQVESAEASVRSASEALAQATAQLALKQAPPRSYDVRSAEAQVEAAQANLAVSQANLSDRILLAPTSGQITKVNQQVGESVSPASPVIVMLADGDYQVKVKVPEADIAKLKNGQVVDITFDAFAPTEHFAGNILFIDPASTMINDVVYYEITVQLAVKDERMKPGMTVNLEIETAHKENALTIPSRALRYENNAVYVDLLKDKTTERRTIKIGLLGDAGVTEVLEGLEEGELVVTRTNNAK